MIARLAVEYDNGVTEHPLAEKVRGGWQNGVRFYPDENVTDYTPLIAIPVPHVPFGPAGVPVLVADANYLDHAASNLEGKFEVGGSNVRATVVKILRDVAFGLRAAHRATTDGSYR